MAITLARRAAGSESSIVRELLTVGDRPGMRSLAGGLPDPESFPAARIAAAVATALAAPALAERALQYGPTDGLPELRAVLAATPAAQRVRGATADEFVVTTGSQQAVHLLAAALVDPGDAVVVDDPCYLGARQVLSGAGAQLVGIRLDADGLDVDALATHLHAGLRPKLVYTVPSFQNPSGAVLHPERGTRLVELARQYGFLVIEDDAYGALGFHEAPPEPLGISAPDVVVTLGTVSKVLAPGLRVGWLRAPEVVRTAVVRMKQAADLHTSTLNQAIVTEVFADHAFLDAHLGTIRARYATRAGALAGALRVDGVEFSEPRGGLFVWARLHDVDTALLLERALTRNVMFVPGDAFAVQEQWRDHVRLSFATLPPDALYAAATEVLVLAGLAPARAPHAQAAVASDVLAAHSRA